MGENKKRPKRHFIINLVGIILCIVFIPIVVVNFTLIVKTYTDPYHIPDFMGVSPVICMTDSMAPEFATGDMIFIKNADHYALDEGDIICYLAPGEIAVTHRIVSKHTGSESEQVYYITRGDSHRVEDEYVVYPNSIEGVYTGICLPNIGGWAMFMQSGKGILLFIVLPFVLLIIWDFILRRIRIQKQKNISVEE